jgi:hypothetical protein
LHWITVKWPALIQPENEDEVSQPGEHEVELRVEIIDRDEAMKCFPGLFSYEPKAGEKIPTGAETFKRVVKDWRKIQANGRTVELNDKNIALLLSSPMFEQAFAVAYVMALGGRAEAREGNSSASPRGGRGANGKAATKRSAKTASVSA